MNATATPAGGLPDGGGGGGALGDVIVDALRELLRLLVTPIRTVIEAHGDAVLRVIVGTPHPDAVFAAPTNNAWPDIHGFYWGTMLPLSLSLYGLAIGLVILFEATSHLFSGYHRAKLKRRAFSGLLGILAWWWIAALSLRFMDTLAGVLVPSVSDITLFETLSFAGMGVLGLVIALSTDLVLFVLIGLIYLARQLALYLFVLLMPILIVLWVPGVGPFTLVARFVRKLVGFYVPFLFMPVPVALLFRLGELLGTSADLSAGGIGAWLTALVIPFLAVLSPLLLFWQAGVVFFLADRVSTRISRRRAGARVDTGRKAVATTRHGGRNLVRGVRDEPAIADDGQMLLDSGDSRAHSIGQRLDSAGTRVRSAIAGDSSDGGGSGGSNGGSGGGGSEGSRNGGRVADGSAGGGDSPTAPGDGAPDRTARDASAPEDTGPDGSGRTDGGGRTERRAIRDPPNRPDRREWGDDRP